MLLKLKPLLTREEALRLGQRMHPWEWTTMRALRKDQGLYRSLVEAEKLYINEVEAILERVARRFS